MAMELRNSHEEASRRWKLLESTRMGTSSSRGWAYEDQQKILWYDNG